MQKECIVKIKKTAQEKIQEKLNKMKELEKEIKELEKKETAKRLKPLFNLFEKNIHKITDDELKKMIEYYDKKFKEKIF